MVLERIAFAKKYPIRTAGIAGFVYMLVGIFLGVWKFSSNSGLFAVFFTVVAGLPLFYSTIVNEELVDFEKKSEWGVLKSHLNVFKIFLMFFLGVLFASTLVGLVFNPIFVENTFDSQSDAIRQINPSLVGNAISNSDAFFDIFLHNLEILILCIFFSFLYGAGAIFILTWNASIVGVAISKFILSQTGPYALNVGYGLLRFLLHGIPELLAFIIAGLAGGIISVAIIRHHLSSKKAQNIIIDSAVLIVISISLLLLAAIIEVFFTPLIVKGF